MFRQGIEPGSTAWQSRRLTTLPAKHMGKKIGGGGVIKIKGERGKIRREKGERGIEKETERVIKHFNTDIKQEKYIKYTFI